MSRIFSDRDLLTWEAYTSGGAFGLPDNPKVVFHCLSDPDRRPLYVEHDGNDATAQRELMEMREDALRELLTRARELG